MAEVGAGGMSTVWRAVDEVLRREVAVKVLAPDADATVNDRLRHEAQAVARLTHPYIAPVYDYGEFVDEHDQCIAYVVMELVRGESLAARLREEISLPWREAVTIGAQVAAALAHAHALHIVHRDVTPGNVMLTTAGAKVVDFGIAAAVGDGEFDANGVLLGTPAYLAPERLAGGSVGTAGDVYALGLLLYRCLTGSRPWSAATATEMVRAHRYYEPEPLPALPGLPADVVDICHGCIAKDPAERPTAAEVAFALADAVGLALPVVETVAPVVENATIPVPGATAVLGTATSVAVTANAGPSRDGSVGLVAAALGRTVRRKRVLAGVGAAAILVGAAVFAANRDESPAVRTVGAERMAAAALAPACRVQYQIKSQGASQFEATVVAANAGEIPWDQAALTFRFPADQTIVHAVGPQWTQEGATVTVRLGGPLPTGKSASFEFLANAPQANPLPTAFTINGVPCAADVRGAAPSTVSATAPAGAPPKPNPKKDDGPEPGKPKRK